MPEEVAIFAGEALLEGGAAEAVGGGLAAGAIGGGEAAFGAGLASELGVAGAGLSAGEGLAALGAGGGGLFEGIAGGGAGAFASASDPIQALSILDSLGGGQGASAGAQALGFASPQAALESINPMWTVTADASMGGMMSKFGQGVTPGDLFRTAMPGGVSSGISNLAGGLFGPIGGGTSVAGMPVGISPFDIGRGLYGMYQSNKLKDLVSQMSAKADPYGPYRPQAAATLNQLSQNPSMITSMPGYEAGNQAVQRSMAAQGYQGSGNMMTALQKYGGDFYNNAINQYAMLSGAGYSPASAQQLNLQGNVDSLQLAGNSLNSLGYGAAGGAGRRNPYQLY